MPSLSNGQHDSGDPAYADASSIVTVSANTDVTQDNDQIRQNGVSLFTNLFFRPTTTNTDI